MYPLLACLTTFAHWQVPQIQPPMHMHRTRKFLAIQSHERRRTDGIVDNRLGYYEHRFCQMSGGCAGSDGGFFNT